jgi:gluconokinase
MPSIPELLSPYESIDGLVYFPRMLSKIRLHAAGMLPEEYIPYLGEAFEGRTFDARCCRFLGVPYEQLVARTLEGGTDSEILAWARQYGNNPSEEQITLWSSYAAKRGWRDDGSEMVSKRVSEAGANPEAILTFFDLIEIDEERKKSEDFLPEPLLPGPFTPKNPTIIPGLLSPYEETQGLVYFPRMISKIILAAAGQLPEDWNKARGYGGNDPVISMNFDALCCRFLGIDYAALEQKVLAGETDPATLLAWAFTLGTHPNEEEIVIWSTFLRKRCWRDEYTHRLHFRLEEAGLPPAAVQCMFDFIDLDEGRPLRSE